MSGTTPEAAMRRACDAILQGNFFSAMADLTPEAMNEAMTLAGGLTSVPAPESYVIETHEESNGGHRYGVRFKTSAQEIKASVTWREVDGAWRITSIDVEGL